MALNLRQMRKLRIPGVQSKTHSVLERGMSRACLKLEFANKIHEINRPNIIFLGISEACRPGSRRVEYIRHDIIQFRQ